MARVIALPTPVHGATHFVFYGGGMEGNSLNLRGQLGTLVPTTVEVEPARTIAPGEAGNEAGTEPLAIPAVVEEQQIFRAASHLPFYSRAISGWVFDAFINWVNAQVELAGGTPMMRSAST